MSRASGYLVDAKVRTSRHAKWEKKRACAPDRAQANMISKRLENAYGHVKVEIHPLYKRTGNT